MTQRARVDQDRDGCGGVDLRKMGLRAGIISACGGAAVNRAHHSLDVVVPDAGLHSKREVSALYASVDGLGVALVYQAFKERENLAAPPPPRYLSSRDDFIVPLDTRGYVRAA